VLDSSSALRRQDIGIKVRNGVVYLNGQVQTKEESDIAENLTYSVVGVSGIRNNIAVGKRFAPKQQAASNSSDLGTQPPAVAAGSGDSAAQQGRINQLLTEGQQRAEMGEYAVARDLYVAVLAIDPNNERALEGRRYTRRMLMQQRRNKAR
jgi:hypothetical protein